MSAADELAELGLSQRALARKIRALTGESIPASTISEALRGKNGGHTPVLLLALIRLMARFPSQEA